jgi:hypothetical protein
MSMRRLTCVTVVLVAALAASPAAQQGRGGRGAAAVAEPRVEAAMVNCPSVVGTGAHTARTYCDVTIGNDAEMGIIVSFPPHTGPVTLRFDLHNRHIYSEDLVKANRAFSRYTAGIGVLTPDNYLVTRAAIQSEFRTEADLFDRITGGGGPSGLKAVAPTGLEQISVSVPEEHAGVSILGEKLLLERMEGADTFTAVGRPIALISNVRVEYTPAPPPRTPPARR